MKNLNCVIIKSIITLCSIFMLNCTIGEEEDLYGNNKGKGEGVDDETPTCPSAEKVGKCFSKNGDGHKTKLLWCEEVDGISVERLVDCAETKQVCGFNKNEKIEANVCMNIDDPDYVIPAGVKTANTEIKKETETETNLTCTPTLLTPINGGSITTEKVVLTWKGEGCDNAQYVVKVGKNLTTPKIRKETSDTSMNIYFPNGTDPDDKWITKGGTVTWQVAVCGDASCSDLNLKKAVSRSFVWNYEATTTTPSSTLPVPQIVSPGKAASLGRTNATLIWQIKTAEVGTGHFYQVEMSGCMTGNLNTFLIHSYQGSYTISAWNKAMTCNWRVRACASNGCVTGEKGGWSESSSFKY